MADTQPLAPTDAEIAALVDAFDWEGWICPTAAKRAFARAALAKWGAQPVPASAAEFALQALVAAGHVTQERVDQAMALPGAPKAPAHSVEPVKLLNFAVLDDGELRLLSGRKAPPFDCELYAMPDGGKAPPLYAAPQPVAREPLTDEQIEKLREATFSTGNPFCPCDSKTMRKAVQSAERAHGITKGVQHDPD